SLPPSAYRTYPRRTSGIDGRSSSAGAPLGPGAGDQICDEPVNVRSCGAMVDDGGANYRATVERRQRRCGHAPLLQVHDDRRLRLVALAAQSEADDVERDRRHDLELRQRPQARLQVPGDLAAMLDRRTDPVSAQGLEGKPGLKGSKPSRQVGAEI